jgi:hypothetical protein
MTQKRLHPAHVHFNPNQRCDRETRTQMRADADAMLRDIALVLKLTQRVRDEIEAEQEIQEPVSV